MIRYPGVFGNQFPKECKLSHAACQFQKISTAHLSFYWVLLGFECLSKETSSLELLSGQNWEDLSIAASSISQNCKWGH